MWPNFGCYYFHFGSLIHVMNLLKQFSMAMMLTFKSENLFATFLHHFMRTIV